MMDIRGYLPLFKLRIAFLITFSAIVSFIATEGRNLSLDKMGVLFLVVMMASAGSGAMNHYIDRDIDEIMGRTQKRPLPIGNIKNPRNVLIFASLLFLSSIIISFAALNSLVALHLFLGGFVYVVVYTVWLKRRSWLNIIIGGLAGSFAVLAGGASARPELCLPPILLAIVIFFWTPSHFLSFAIFYKEEYRKAGIPMLPVLIGERKTSLFILLNTILLFGSSLLPFIFGLFGYIYLLTAISLGIFFIFRNIQLLVEGSREMAWKNFKASMLYLGVLFLSVIIDVGINS